MASTAIINDISNKPDNNVNLYELEYNIEQDIERMNSMMSKDKFTSISKLTSMLPAANLYSKFTNQSKFGATD